MKKVLIPIGIILVIVGIIIVGVYGGADAWKNLWTQDLSEAKTQHSYNVSASETQEKFDIVNIEITTDAFDVYVRKTEENAVTVKYSDSLPKGVDISVNYLADSKTLKIEETEPSAGFVFVWGFNRSNRFLIVDVPCEMCNGELSVHADIDVGKFEIKDMALNSIWCETATGSIFAENCSVKNDSHLESNTGGVTLKNHEGVKVVLQSSTGRVSAIGVKCENLQVEVQTGSADVTECSVNESIQISSSTGAVSCASASKSLSIVNHTGSVYFKTRAEIINVEVNTGSLKGVVEGKKAEYNIIVDKGTGNSNLENQLVAGGKQLRVKANTGSIDVSFLQN